MVLHLKVWESRSPPNLASSHKYLSNDDSNPTLYVLAATLASIRYIPGTENGAPDTWVSPYPIGKKIFAAANTRDGP